MIGRHLNHFTVAVRVFLCLAAAKLIEKHLAEAGLLISLCVLGELWRLAAAIIPSFILGIV